MPHEYVPAFGWMIPFALLLLAMAVLPLATPHLWESNLRKLGVAVLLGLPVAVLYLRHHPQALVHAATDYVSFIILLGSLFVVSGGILVTGDIQARPAVNTAFLAVGALLASFIGTTGASMLLIRPLLATNRERRRRAHTVVFFIFVVSNVGGCLTPLGDPPLFLGFLQGVDFFWTAMNILAETLFLLGALLALFYVIDRHYYAREGVLPFDPTPDTPALGFDGARNFALLALIVGLVLLSGFWKSDTVFEVFGTPIGLPGLVRDAGLVAVVVLSLLITRASVHHANQFAWEPMREVAKLFAGIFLTIAPVIAMLKAGAGGPFGAVVAAVTGPDGEPSPAMYFWATGLLSSFLDNAPTYLVFFNTAGGDPDALMTRHATTLAAISAGAVFMGAMSYIGNAPNLMVKAIAESRGVRMPTFFGYMAWSCSILMPLFILVTFIFFR